MELTIALVRAQEFICIREPTQGRYLISVMHVARASGRSLVFTAIKESTQKRNSINLSVIRTSAEIHCFTFRDFT